MFPGEQQRAIGWPSRNHRAASAVRSVHTSFVRNIKPLAVNAHAIATVLTFPIDIVNALRITAIATRPVPLCDRDMSTFVPVRL
jgi:hypothetical protein